MNRVPVSPRADSAAGWYCPRMSLRMHVRRLTRLANAHSERLDHHAAMSAIFIAYLNLCRKHETLKGKTPAMVVGLANRTISLRALLCSAIS